MTLTRACLTAGLLLVFPAGAATADQNDSRLDELFLIIQQTDDPEVADSAETVIWQIWLQHDNSASTNSATDSASLALFNWTVIK